MLVSDVDPLTIEFKTVQRKGNLEVESLGKVHGKEVRRVHQKATRKATRVESGGKEAPKVLESEDQWTVATPAAATTTPRTARMERQEELRDERLMDRPNSEASVV